MKIAEHMSEHVEEQIVYLKGTKAVLFTMADIGVVREVTAWNVEKGLNKKCAGMNELL